MRRLVAIYDNAMLYKDLTQWIRTKAFISLFTGLLLFGEFFSVLFAYTENDEPTGAIAFGFLTGVLNIYMLITGFSGFVHTGREFSNRTFELYELSGMSLEKLVLGKFTSLMAQFFFGFFCLVPFMFFAFLLGGLDFYTIVTAIVSTALAAPPVYLTMIAAAFLNRGRTGNVIARVILTFFGFFVVMFGFQLISVLFYFRMGISPGSGSGGLLGWLISLKYGMVAPIAIFAFFYSQVCLLLFYVSCHAISPPADSREVPVKGAATLLCLSWMGLFHYLYLIPRNQNEGTIYLTFIPVAIILLLLGLVFFYQPVQVPRMAIDRKKRSRFPTLHALFEPGPVGMFRTMLLIFLFVIGCALVYQSYSGGGLSTYNMPRAIANGVSYVIEVPFFLAFPAGLLLNLRKVAHRPQAVRILVFGWWLIATAILLVLLAITAATSQDFANPFIEFFMLLFSPITTFFVGTSSSSAYYDSAPVIRMILGVVGAFLILSGIRRRKKLAAANLPPSSPPSAPPGPPSPPSLPPTTNRAEPTGSAA